MRLKIKFLYIILLIFICNSVKGFAANKVALLQSDYTIAAMSSSNPNWYPNQFSLWESQLTQASVQYDIITDSQVEAGILSNYQLLVIPPARYVSDLEIQKITDFLNSGNSVFACWSFAVFKEDQSWRGWSVLNSLFGIDFVKELSPATVARKFNIKGDSPITSNVPVGFQLQLTSFDAPVVASVTSTSTFSLGSWEDSLYIENETSLVYGHKSIGSFIWVGFNLSEIVGAQSHQDQLKNIFSQSINWLTNGQVAWVNTWPNAYNAAAVLSCDVEFQFDNINNALTVLEQEGVEGQFFILTDLMTTSTTNRILQNGDVGIHGDNHDTFKGQTYQQQFTRLQNAKTALENFSGRTIYSMRPPNTEFDDNTVQALKDLNFKVLASDFTRDRFVPQFVDSENKLLIIPKSGFDDFDIFDRYFITDTAQQASIYINDYKKIYSIGGMYTLYYHSQTQSSSPANAEVLRTVIKKLKSDNTWITTINKTADWWLQRNNLILSSAKVTDKNFLLTITNNNSMSVNNIDITFTVANINVDSAISVKVGNADVQFVLNKSNREITIPITSMSAFQTIQFSIQIGTTGVTDVLAETDLNPVGFSLSQNYPNPFNPSTTIKFSVPKQTFVNLSVYNLIGQKVATIISESLNAGSYSTVFNAKNLSSGVYFYRIQAGSFTQTKKFILSK